MASFGRTCPRSLMLLSRPGVVNGTKHACRITGSRSYEAGLRAHRLPTSLHHEDGMEGAGFGGVKASTSMDSDLSALLDRNGAHDPSRTDTERSMSLDDGLSSILNGTSHHYDDLQDMESVTQSTSMDDLTSVKMDAKRLMDAGELVPDTVAVKLLQERLSSKECQLHGWLLDGFPRTESQAQAMESCGIVPDVVITLRVSDSDVMDRLIHRRCDPVTGTIYNLKHRPPTCPNVKRRLIQRSDDVEDTIRTRLRTYYTNLDPIMRSFREKNITVIEVDAGEEVYKTIRSELVKLVLSGMHQAKDCSLDPLRIVLEGPPGCGKGTQAEYLRADFGTVHISMGELLRKCVAEVEAFEIRELLATNRG